LRYHVESKKSDPAHRQREREGALYRIVVRFAVASIVLTPAYADSLPDIAQFAQSICGDIPAGNLTRTTIQGQIGANASLLAKVLTGDANVSGSRTDEIYNGVPFDKLPDNIPTVAMCKVEVVKLLLVQKAQIINNAPGGIIQSGTDNKGTVINNK
jgi:hypothetical protein